MPYISIISSPSGILEKDQSSYRIQINAAGEPLGIKQMSQDISNRCSATPADVLMVLEAAGEYMFRKFLNGFSVNLFRIGTFKLKLKMAHGSDPADKIRSSNVKMTGISFYPDKERFKELKKEIVFSIPDKEVEVTEVQEERLLHMLSLFEEKLVIRPTYLVSECYGSRSTIMRDLKVLVRQNKVVNYSKGLYILKEKAALVK